MSIAQRVKRARARKGLTGLQLTERLRHRGVDVSHSWLRNIESGAHHPTPALRLLALSKELGMSLERLLTGRGKS